MRHLKLAAIGVVALGMASHAALPQLSTGIAAQASQLENHDYRPGVGLNAFVGVDQPMLNSTAAGGMGVRANYENYQLEGDEAAGTDLNEGGVALTGMIGPNLAFLQPRIGAHVGYARLEEENFLDLGADLMATYKFNPQLGMHALVTPTWFLNDDQTDYYGTKVGLGITWTTPGG